jgi:lipoprotein-anchoring transpeptidase ErfK/SrfK
LRTSISLATIVLALAGSVAGAAAQYYPPQPPPPAYSPYSPRPYTSAPLPPPSDESGATPPAAAYRQAAPSYGDARPSPYGPGFGGRAAPGPQQSDAYPPANPPYFAPDKRTAPQPAAPTPAVAPGLLPPADVGSSSAPAYVTGTVRAPAAAPGGGEPSGATTVAALPPEYQPEQGPPQQLPPRFSRQLVNYVTKEPAGTIIVDTPHTYLYLILGHGKALRYGIGVGREGFTWSGTERIARMKEWPDWYPPKEMIARQPYLPRFMAGGLSNPLGARALYLGNTLYRIHGTNQPSTIGTFVSSGCIRLTNEDIEDLYDRVTLGTRVVVLPGSPPVTASAPNPAPPSSENPPAPVPQSVTTQ